MHPAIKLRKELWEFAKFFPKQLRDLEGIVEWHDSLGPEVLDQLPYLFKDCVVSYRMPEPYWFNDTCDAAESYFMEATRGRLSSRLVLYDGTPVGIIKNYELPVVLMLRSVVNRDNKPMRIRWGLYTVPITEKSRSRWDEDAAFELSDVPSSFSRQLIPEYESESPYFFLTEMERKFDQLTAQHAQTLKTS